MIARSPRRRRVLLALGGCALLGGCAGGPPGEAAPLAGRVVDARGRFVAERDLVEALLRTRYRLLGERHDNPSHATLRARWIDALAAAGARPAVVMEIFTLDHDAALREAQSRGADADALAAAGGLDRGAWLWPMHRPIVEAALRAGLPVRAANLPRTALRGAALDDALRGDSAWAGRLRASPWSAAQADALRESIVDGHCGKLPEAAVPRIALAQRARDAAMAQALVDAATADGAVLIAGNGHVRRDLGVPAYLHEDRGVAVGLVEVMADEAANARRDDRKRAFDFVAFTTATAREDPCGAMPAVR